VKYTTISTRYSPPQKIHFQMKPKSTLRNFLAIAGSSLLMISATPAQTTYTWANSNVTGTPVSILDWYTGGSNTQGTWIGGDPVSSNLNTIQIFENMTTALPNTANPSTQTINLNNGGDAFELGTLTLSGRGSATANANLTMTLSGDALNFSAATGTINLDAVNNTRTITYNVANAIQLGTASSATALTFAGNGNGTFNFTGNITELQAGGGSLVKSGSSTVTLSGANNFTGGIQISGGTLAFANSGAWGGSGKNVSFTGTGRLTSSFDGYSGGTLSVASGATATITGSNSISFATTTGSGTLITTAGQNKITNIGDAGNFTGNLAVAYATNTNSTIGTPHLQFSNLADTAGSSIQFYRTGGGTDSGQIAQVGLAGNAGSLTFNNRQIQILPRSGTTNPSLAGVTLLNNNSSAANTWVINTNLLNESDRNVNFILAGSNAGSNQFAGTIGDSTFAGPFTSGTGVLTLQKQGTGAWILSGTNTYTGGTSVTAGTLTFLQTTAKSSTGTHAFGAGTTLGLGVNGASGFTSADILNAFAGTLTGNLSGVTLNASTVIGIDTTLGNFEFSDSITGSPARALTKLGNNTLTLSGSNTFTGVLTVANGTLSTATVNNASTDGPLGNSANAVVLGSSGGNTGTLLYTGSTASSTKTFSMATGGTGSFNIGASTDLTLSGVISGAGTLSKTGAGKLILTNSANTHSGSMTISSGILEVGGSGRLNSGTYAGAVSIANGANLVISTSATQTLNGAITGLGSITKTGAGTLTLSNSGNDYSGGFNLDSGTVSIGSGVYNGFGKGIVTFNGGTLSYGSSGPTMTYNNDMVWNASITLNRASSGTPISVFNGDITLGGNAGYANGSTTVSNALIFNGNVSETGGSRSFTGSVGNVAGNSMTFNGQNTFTGAITGGGSSYAVTVGGSGYLGGGSYAGTISSIGSFTYSSSANQILSGTISGTTLTKDTSASSTLTLSGSSVFSGLTSVAAGTLQFAKTASLNSGNTANWTAARINVKDGATLAFNVGGTGEFTTGNVTTLFTNLAASSSATNGMNAGSNFGFDTINAAGGSFTIGDVIADSTGISGGARGLTKLGTGSLVLTNANTYTGGTLVNAGKLLINGSTSASSTVTVASGATLGGSGTVAGNTTIAGIHSPGNSPGIQTFGADLTYEAGSSVIWELVNNTALLANRGSAYDGINVGGTLSFEGATTIQLVFSGALNQPTGSIVDWSDIFWSTSRLGTNGWLIYSGATDLVGFDNLGISAENWVDGLGQSYNSFFGGNGFSLFQDGDDIYLNYNFIVIPEPKAALLGALGFLMLFRRRRS